MKTYLAKIRHILPTFLLVTISTVVLLALLRWLLCIRFSLVDIKEEVWVLWLPLLFPWIPITLWLRQRFRVLVFKGDSDKPRFFLQLVAWGTIGGMLFVSQAYLTTATGKLQKLPTIRYIDNVEKVRYYQIRQFAVAPDFGGEFTSFTTSGKNNQTLNMGLYFVVPIMKDTSERITQIPKYWYGLRFSKSISNSLSDAAKESIYKGFFDNCVEKMNRYRFDSLEYFERKPNSEDRQNYMQAIQSRINRPPVKNTVLLEPVHTKYEDRNGDKLAWIFGVLGIGLTVLLFLLIWPKYSETERQKFLAGKKPKHDDLRDVLNYLVPKETHFATSIILDLNILVYLVMVFSGVHPVSPSGLDLLQWGANRRAETMDGEWWRLFSSMFLHSGFMHLFLNISGLVIAAFFVEPALGRKKYFILYLFSGLCGSLTSIIWYRHSISVGASGAIFGLFGAVFGLLATNAFSKGSREWVMKLAVVYVGISLLWGLTGGVDNAAHIGGLLSGALAGAVLYKLGNNQKTVI